MQRTVRSSVNPMSMFPAEHRRGVYKLVNYLSDFTSGQDGFYASDCTAAGAIDGIEGQDGCLRLTMGSIAPPLAWHDITRSNTFRRGQLHRIELDYYIPSGNDGIDGFRIKTGQQVTLGDDLEVTGSWQSVDFMARVDGTGSMGFYAMDGGVEDVGDAVFDDDVIYFKNIIVTAHMPIERGIYGPVVFG